MKYYKLNDAGEPYVTEVLLDWAQWFEHAHKERVVKQEVVGESEISTVFLGLDVGFGDRPPILWETMVFGGKLDQEQRRCSGNREQAEAMHAEVVERVKEAECPKV